MQRKDHIDAFGAVSLIGFSAIIGFNQVVIKLVNGGLQPVFAAGVRSVGAVVLLFLWMRLRRHPLHIAPGTAMGGLVAGLLFGTEFICIFIALDLTTVARSSVIFYTMPVWLALMSHVAVPDDRITARKALGLALAVAGVAWAILDRGAGGTASLAGDLLALAAALCWAAIALFTRISGFSRIEPPMQLMWQVAVSAVMLLALAPLFGPLVRDFQPVHVLGVLYQTAVVATGAFLFWFWLLKRYPAPGVASFSFLSPIFGVGFGWLILGERIGASVWGALALVAVGLVLINRPARAVR